MKPFFISYPPFLESEIGEMVAENSLFHVIPVPLEQSVSYGHGTARGPSAILKASQQLELYDGHSSPAEQGIYTAPAVKCSGKVENILKKISTEVTKTLDYDAVPVLLGGEHTVTCGAVKALIEKLPSFGVVQFDAHADLRDSYEGSRYSHACVMRRICEQEIPVVQIGVRSLSREEVKYRSEKNICFHDAERLFLQGIPELLLPDSFPENLYITFDIDALCPSIMPSTGTPEPGGLQWYQAMTMLDSIISEKNVMGFDVTELAPVKGLHAPDFTAARLVYNIMGMISRKRFS